jgi:hypothetical protein
MFSDLNLTYELVRLRKKKRNVENNAVSEAKKILKRDLFTEKKVLQNLKQYGKSFEALDEEYLESDRIFTLNEIKRIAVLYRLKFLESKYFKPEIPDQIHLKINALNNSFNKEIKDFKILAPHGSFVNTNTDDHATMFVKTNDDNYYLVVSWGKALNESRKFKFIHLRSFETLVTTVLILTFILTMSLPTRLITLDHTAEYWSGYRAAAFFHLLIFNFGVTVYFTFTFSKNFSGTVWNRYKDFD